MTTCNVISVVMSSFVVFIQTFVWIKVNEYINYFNQSNFTHYKL